MRRLSTLLLLGLAAGLLAPAPRTRAGDDKKPILKKDDKLTADDERDRSRKQSYAKVYEVKLKGGQAYRIDMTTTEDPKKFDPYLRLENDKGRQLAFDDDSGGNYNARIIYKADADGTYKVIATTFGPNMTGPYTLTVKLATKEDEAAKKDMDQKLAAAQKAQQEMQKKVLEIQKKVNEFRSASADEQKEKLTALVKEFTARKGTLDQMDAQYALSLAQSLESSDKAMATAAYKDLGKALAQAGNSQIARRGRMLEGSARRLNLVGNTMTVSGKTLQGKEVNLKDYRGKVVLVDFWATWCGPCIAEMPNVKRLYKTYHDKGFEVLAVSVDQNKAALEKFLEKNELPWVCIHDVPGDDSLSNQYGVTFIPLPILVDREGRVVSMNARGPELERLLEKYLGDKENKGN
jgi:thiol-disulfide isomerase/thioredoxin